MSRVLQGVSAAHSSTAKVRTRPHTRAHTLSSGRASRAVAGIAHGAEGARGWAIAAGGPGIRFQAGLRVGQQAVLAALVGTLLLERDGRDAQRCDVATRVEQPLE